MKISKGWLKTANIYEQIIGSEMSEDEQLQLYIYESSGKAEFKKHYPNLNKPTSLHYKEAFDLLNTEILDCIKYSFTKDNWYYLYKIDKFFGYNLNSEILDFIVKDKKLRPHQIDLQEVIWNMRDKEMLELESKLNEIYFNTKKLDKKIVERMEYLLSSSYRDEIDKEIERVEQEHQEYIKMLEEQAKYRDIEYQKQCYVENKQRRQQEKN